MDTIKKILHPHQDQQQQHSSSDTTTTTTAAAAAPPHTHADAPTTDALGSEPNITGADRQPPTHGDFSAAPSHASPHDSGDSGAIKQPRAGHHHPRQPVGATGLPPNHRPREDFVNTQHQQEQQQPEQQQQQEQHRVVAESGNNFPGTNPHPAHSALGNESMTGEKGSFMPGREYK